MESPSSKPLILIISILSSLLIATVTTTTTIKQHQPITNAVQNAKHQVHQPIQVGVSELEKQEFLAAHNKIRLQEREPPLIWDSGLALYARQYAIKRSADCNLVHSNGPYGENIFWGGGSQWAAADAVRLWDDEKKDYDRASNTCQPGKMCGHYTQIVWRNSVRLGCARVECQCGDIFAICSYDPPGNYVGESPFGDNS